MKNVEKIQNYPICDTDIWIKVSNIDDFELFFCEYDKLNIAEVVQHEIEIVSKEKGFSAFNNFNYYKKNGKLNVLKFFEFDDDEKNTILHLFALYDIPADENGVLINNRKKDSGEIVSLIYASILNIPIILSDDKNEIFHAFDIKKINFKNLLKKKYSNDKIKVLLSKANVNNQYQKDDLEKYYSSGKFKRIDILSKIYKF